MNFTLFQLLYLHIFHILIEFGNHASENKPNTMAAEALAACVARTSAATILIA